MSRAAGRVALAALRSVSQGPVLLDSRTANPRGALPPGRPGEQGLRSSFPLLVHPARLLPWLGGRVRSAATGAGTPNALARTVLGLGARVCPGGVSKRLAGSIQGGGARDSSRPRGSGLGELPSVIKECTDAAGLLKLVEEHGQSFNAIHLGAAWGSLARMRGAGGRGAEGVVVQRLQVLTKAKTPDLGARQVANIVHSIAKMHSRGRTGADDELAGKLLSRALATARDFVPQNVANLVWALATMGVKADARLLEAMQARATATAGDFNPQD
ncbi:hypothetical protein T484DRAFT_1888188, partial [Baffinella frigidus]